MLGDGAGRRNSLQVLVVHTVLCHVSSQLNPLFTGGMVVLSEQFAGTLGLRCPFLLSMYFGEELTGCVLRVLRSPRNPDRVP